ncbi:MAG: formate dehydrogenase subunit delta [Alphaproteobacteria bacterium]
MDATRLVQMANQIAAFFAAYPKDKAVAATRDHFLRFWDPRMREDLVRLIRSGPNGLSEIALAAAFQLAASPSKEAR